MILLDRKRREEDPHLDWKVKLFFIGAALALAGIAVNSTWLIGAAVLALLAGAGLRFLPGKKNDARNMDGAGKKDDV
jgi:hypothetical protein